VRLDDLGLVFGSGGHLVSSCETERRQSSGAAVSGVNLRSPVKPTGVVLGSLPKQQGPKL